MPKARRPRLPPPYETSEVSIDRAWIAITRVMMLVNGQGSKNWKASILSCCATSIDTFEARVTIAPPTAPEAQSTLTTHADISGVLEAIVFAASSMSATAETDRATRGAQPSLRGGQP